MELASFLIIFDHGRGGEGPPRNRPGTLVSPFTSSRRVREAEREGEERGRADTVDTVAPPGREVGVFLGKITAWLRHGE